MNINAFMRYAVQNHFSLLLFFVFVSFSGNLFYFALRFNFYVVLHARGKHFSETPHVCTTTTTTPKPMNINFAANRKMYTKKLN